MNSSPGNSMSREEWDRRGALLRAAEARSRASMPTVCKFCGTPGPIPTFVDLAEWQCANYHCSKIWRVE